MERKPDWSWDNLRYFLAVARLGTLSDAARQLSVSHSTVQRRIGAMENELHTSLFNRTASGYTLTQAGTALFKEASQVQITLDSISKKIGDSDQQVSGEVVITSTDTLSFFILPGLIRSLTELYPQLDIRLEMMNGLSDVQNLEADIAVRTCTEPPADLIGRQVGPVEFTACASKEYCSRTGITQVPADIDRYQAVMLDQSFAATPFYQWMDEHLSAAGRITVANGFLSAYGLCRAGLGITLLPLYMIDQTDELVVLEAGVKPTANELWILSHRDLRTTERVRVVRQYLFERLSLLFK